MQNIIFQCYNSCLFIFHNLGGQVVFGRVLGSLAVSRALGDMDFKHPYVCIHLFILYFIYYFIFLFIIILFHFVI